MKVAEALAVFFSLLSINKYVEYVNTEWREEKN